MKKKKADTAVPVTYPARVHYVVGFLFSSDLAKVLMILKARPQWQAGDLNGLGGHVEHDDKSPWHAMARECQQESGIKTDPSQWHRFCTMEFKGGEMDCFCTAGEIGAARDMTDEPLDLRPVSEFHPGAKGVVENCLWLIPAALERLRKGLDFCLEAIYQ